MNSDDEEINPVTMLLLNTDNNQLTKNGKTTELAPLPVQDKTYHLTSINSTLTIRQLPSQGLSFQLWPAAETFVKLFDTYKPSNTDPFSVTVTKCANDRKPIRILELGSGTGIVGITAAAILGGEVTVTDLPHVLPNMEYNVELNREVVVSGGGEVRVARLSWGEVGDMEVIGRGYDLVIGSDVVYHDNLYEPLIQTLKFLLLGSGDQGEKEGERVFLMGHLRRWKKESSFFKKVRKMFRVDVVHEDGPSSVSRTGVVVYRFARKDAVFR
ncbi:methyltransferase family protein [Artemisia annua]|uniref:Methyltransferase family protein n=1 Tax=Artemisia annua TaxID=35608 RepID=A0A2U1MMU6_ARTAN|nr:methyltransferase family protein [Artemisia annua]